MQISIRTPDRLEKEAWLPLWKAYLAFYGSNLSDDTTELTWERFHSDASPMYIIAAYENGNMAGFTTYVLHASTWASRSYCYLEDLFVASQHRGKGFARKLVEAVSDAAKAADCERLYWFTKEGNKTAQALYNKLAQKTDNIQYLIVLD